MWNNRLLKLLPARQGFVIFKLNCSAPCPPKKMEDQAKQVLDFWLQFKGNYAKLYGKDPNFDQEIEAKFGSLVDKALNTDELDQWKQTPEGSLSLVLLLDQFTRNIFRDTPKAFAGDTKALEVSNGAVQLGLDKVLESQSKTFELGFLYMPYTFVRD